MLLDRLRQLDLYDRSAIVVTSDHGTARFPQSDSTLAAIASPAGTSLHALELNATPLLLVKPFGAGGPLRTSDAPTAIADLPATLLDLAGLPNALGTGTSVLALDPARRRERTYAHHSWSLRLTANTWASPWFDVLHLFTIEGRVGDPAAWRYREALFGPARDRDAQRRTHRVGLTTEEGCGSSSSTAQGRPGGFCERHGKSYLPLRRRGGEGGGGGLLTGRAIPSAYRWAWCRWYCRGVPVRIEVAAGFVARSLRPPRLQPSWPPDGSGPAHG